jgi:S1-C subfamily serine protease
MNNIPTSTQWTLDAAGQAGRLAVTSVFMIFCQRTSAKGSGFLLKNGYIITNEHVVRHCQANEILAISSLGERISFSNLIVDSQRDLAILKPTKSLDGGLLLGTKLTFEIGNAVSTWGFPLGYNGPAPLLSVGYLSGFMEYQAGSKNKKHLVVNGAFNPGNSGGPLFRSNDDRVVGIVVSKHAPISQFHLTALHALADNQTGVNFTATDDQGNTRNFVESQIVADLLFHFRNLTQVMIGEAVAASELAEFLEENKIPVPE